ncbi:high mobility group AT-hook protein 2 [Microdochium nivale]|nr:high mobility group AT-hook protein 2 [Microdochium nivale]
MPEASTGTTEAGGRTIWNDKTRSDLLIAIMDNISPTDAEVDRIMAKVNEQGYIYNWSAAKQHIQKLKRKEGGGTASTASTPAATPSSKAGGGRKRKTDATAAGGADAPTPTKKSRGRKPKKEKADDDEDFEEKVKLDDMDEDVQNEDA